MAYEQIEHYRNRWEQLKLQMAYVADFPIFDFFIKFCYTYQVSINKAYIFF